MCMEDVRLGRATHVNDMGKTIPATSVIVADNSPKRRILIFYPPVSGTITLGMSSAVTANQGITLTANSHPVILKIDDVGDMTTKRWYAIHSAGNVFMPVFEGLLEAM